MKIIKIRKGYLISAFNGPTESITPALLQSILEPVEKNKAKIIDAAYEIEKLIESIIQCHFFNPCIDLKDKSNEFREQILNSDWCTFSSKRKLIFHIISSKNYMTEKEKRDYEHLLKKVMSYRNAITHGEISTDGREVRLKYFEGSPREITLSEEYFIKVETDLNSCWEITNKLCYTSGTFTIRQL